MADVASAAPVRPETRFQIGSISKSFAAIVAMQEVDAGRLDLHVSVNELLPWLALPEPFGPITMHHLLTHTAGLHTGTEERPGSRAPSTCFGGFPATSAPGERFHYSNDGYKIVGAVLEDDHRLPIHDLLAERLLGPLGMTSSVAAITDEIWTDHATGYEPLLTTGRRSCDIRWRWHHGSCRTRRTARSSRPWSTCAPTHGSCSLAATAPTAAGAGSSPRKASRA